MMNEVTVYETVNKVYTSVTCELLHYLQGGTEIEIPHIILAQEPSEVLNLEFSIPRQNSISIRHEPRNYKLKLTFENFVHEISKNYGYEIFCEILTEDGKHMSLFFCKEMRKDKSIDITDQILVSDLTSIKSSRICFNIYRFNLNKSVTKNIVDQTLVSDSKSINIDRVNLNENVTKNNVDNHILNILNNITDVTIEVGHKKFNAHKDILSSKSQVFKLMCNTEMSEGINGVIVIEDFAPEIIEEMLLYIYTGKCQNLNKTSTELFKVAHRYELNELQAMCEEYFPFILDVQNAVIFLDIANLYDLQELKEAIKTFMQKREKEMVNIKLYQKYLCQNLNMDNIIDTLNLSIKYELQNVKSYIIMNYIKEHQKELAKNSEFLKSFDNNSKLLQEIFINISK